MARMQKLIEDPAPRAQIPEILRMVGEDQQRERTLLVPRRIEHLRDLREVIHADVRAAHVRSPFL